MSRLPLDANAPEDSPLAHIYAEIEELTGASAPSNFLRSMVVRPDIADATWSLARPLLVQGRLPATLTQLMVAAISAQDNCEYCEVAHRRALEALGVSPEIVKSCLHNPSEAPLPRLHREILCFALDAASDPNAVSDASLERLRKLGVSDEELVEVAMTVAFTKLVNTWAQTTAIAVDAPAT